MWSLPGFNIDFSQSVCSVCAVSGNAVASRFLPGPVSRCGRYFAVCFDRVKLCQKVSDFEVPVDIYGCILKRLFINQVLLDQKFLHRTLFSLKDGFFMGVEYICAALDANMSFTWFVSEMVSNPILFITILLTLGVIFVNGWTDAPNAIATCIATRSIPPRPAIIMSAVFNFLGVFVMTLINSTVAMTIKDMVNFHGDTDAAIRALCAALFAIIVWATAAWYFGIPTSESHALIAGLSGAAIALQGGFSGINGGEWVKVLYGLVLSTVLGFLSGFLITKLTELLFGRTDRRKSRGFFKGAQIFGGAAMSFMHGAQDGQKFMGVMILGVFLVNGSETTGDVSLPIWMMLICSIVMALGTSIGGYKIIKAVGMDMVKLDLHQGFSADLAAASCLLLSSVLGIPVSTTHTKTTAIMGVGATKRLSAINLGVVKEMVLTWVLTFPGCAIISFCMVKLFELVF